MSIDDEDLTVLATEDSSSEEDVLLMTPWKDDSSGLSLCDFFSPPPSLSAFYGSPVSRRTCLRMITIFSHVYSVAVMIPNVYVVSHI